MTAARLVQNVTVYPSSVHLDGSHVRRILICHNTGQCSMAKHEDTFHKEYIRTSNMLENSPFSFDEFSPLYILYKFVLKWKLYWTALEKEEENKQKLLYWHLLKYITDKYGVEKNWVISNWLISASVAKPLAESQYWNKTAKKKGLILLISYTICEKFISVFPG